MDKQSRRSLLKCTAKAAAVRHAGTLAAPKVSAEATQKLEKRSRLPAIGAVAQTGTKPPYSSVVACGFFFQAWNALQSEREQTTWVLDELEKTLPVRIVAAEAGYRGSLRSAPTSGS